MKNTLIKALGFLLVFALALPLAACSNGGEGGDTVTGVTSDNATTQAETGYFDYLPKNNYGDADFVIASAQLSEFEATIGTDIVVKDSSSAISSAIYNRNLAVEEEFGVKIVSYTSLTLTEDVMASAGAGDLDYHLVYGVYNQMGTLASGEYLADLNQAEYLMLDESWWNQSAQINLNIGGVQYLAMNDIPYSALISTHCIYYNTATAKDYDALSDLYGEVGNGSWTIDKLIQYSRLAKHENGDGVWDENDSYGLAVAIGDLTMLGVAFGESVYPVTIREGEIVDTDTEKWGEMITKIYDLVYGDDGTYLGQHLSATSRDIFINGNSLFYFGALCYSPMYMRDMKDDFGILPMPKYNEEQDGYRTALSGASLLMGIPVIASDTELEYISIITEAMAKKSNDVLRHAVYDTVMEGQIIREDDNEAAYTSFRTIVDSLYADFVFIYAGGVNGYYGEIHMLMENRSSDFSSMYKRNTNRVTSYYQGILDMYAGH